MDHARLLYVTATIARRCPTTEFKMAAIKPEVEITFDR
jgi:hypothetical protein